MRAWGWPAVGVKHKYFGFRIVKTGSSNTSIETGFAQDFALAADGTFLSGIPPGKGRRRVVGRKSFKQALVSKV
jgi:hypothetical protein